MNEYAVETWPQLMKDWAMVSVINNFFKIVHLNDYMHLMLKLL